MSSSQKNPAFVALVQASAGAIGGVFATFVLMPIEVAKTRIQLNNGGDDSCFAVVRTVAEKDGINGLFRGSGAKCTETGSKNFVYFYIYDFINTLVQARTSSKLSTGMKLVLGYIAGVGTTVVTMPLEVLATKAQVNPESSTNLWAAAAKILATEGMSGLFAGFWFNIFLCINPAIQNTFFDKIKEQILQSQASRQKHPVLTPLHAFILGAVAKAIATIITYPLVRLKTILQAGKDQSKSSIRNKLARKSSTQEMLAIMSTRENPSPVRHSTPSRITELYRGLGSSLTKSVVQAAFLYVTKDQVEGLVRKLFTISAKMLVRRSGSLKLPSSSGRPLAS